MDEHAVDFGFFIPPGSIINVEPDPYQLTDFPGFQDLQYFHNEIPLPNQESSELPIEPGTQQREAYGTQQRETSVPVHNKRISESRYWTKEEQERFNYALKILGTDFEAIANYVGTRNSTQVRTHAQKYYAKMVRDYKKNGKPSLTQAKCQKSDRV